MDSRTKQKSHPKVAFYFQGARNADGFTAWEQEQRRLWRHQQQVQRLEQQQVQLAQQQEQQRVLGQQVQQLLLFCHRQPVQQQRSRPKRESFSCVFQSE